MQRKTVYTLVVMVGLLVAGILGYVYYLRNYPVFSDVSKPDGFPEVSWQDIVQGRVARSLRRQSPPLSAGVYERLGRAWVEEAEVPRAMERYPVMFSRKQWVRGGGMSETCCVWMNNGIG